MRYGLLGVFLLCAASTVSAQEVHQDLVGVVRADVTAILEEGERDIIGTDTTTVVQRVEAVLVSGAYAGRTVQFDNDITPLEPGDDIFLNHLRLIDGSEYFEFKDFDRRAMLVALAALFMGVLVFFSGVHGLRALMSLAASAGIIFFVLVPLLLAGYPPMPTSVLVAGGVLAAVMFGTHGVNARAVIAFSGTFVAIIATGVLSYVWVHATRLTGFGSDASVYLNFSTNGSLDFVGLLLGSIIIGALGVLDDVAITQSSVVRELARSRDRFSGYELYRRAMRVGRDHVGSLVNTLALAYAGVSLPLILLFAQTDATVGAIVNQEVVAAELVRTFVGSIGLILAVPITTAIAAWWFGTHTPAGDEGDTHHH